MLEKYLNKEVTIFISNYGSGHSMNSILKKEGIITGLDENFVELDNNKLISIKYIMNIEIV